MAFPTNPAEGQIYKDKIFSSSSNSWVNNNTVIETGTSGSGVSWKKFSDRTAEVWCTVDLSGQPLNTQATATKAMPFTVLSVLDYQFSVLSQVGAGSAAMIGSQAYNGVYSATSPTSIGVTSYSYRIDTKSGSEFVRYYCKAKVRW